MPKKWRLYEHIPQIDYIYLFGILYAFSAKLSDFGIKNSIKEVLGVMKKFDGYFYFYPSEYHKTQKGILNRIIKNPDWGIKFNQKLKKLLDDYFEIARKVQKTSLSKLFNKELADLWEKLFKAKELSHAMGVVTTWILDADDQPFTRHLSKGIERPKSNLDAAEIFPILTTPVKISYIQEEEIELYKLLEKATKNGLYAIYKEIENFAEKYGWIYYKYIGPTKTAKEYEEILKDWLKQKISPKTELEKISNKIKQRKQRQRQVLKQLKPDKKLLKTISFAQSVIYLKDYRKMSQFYGSYVNEKILKEVAKRLSLSLVQVRHFLPWEIAPVLRGNSFDFSVLNKRYEYSVLRVKGAKYEILTGKKARDYLKKQKFEKIKTDVGKAKGICACPGKTKGVARIINLPEQIGKIKQGEIMISHATYPVLVPAMKKASAIVTDEGGITSHAAIVSRELGTPCVVGTKVATQVFKDGDKVEVDANKGIVRKL